MIIFNGQFRSLKLYSRATWLITFCWVVVRSFLRYESINETKYIDFAPEFIVKLHRSKILEMIKFGTTSKSGVALPHCSTTTKADQVEKENHLLFRMMK